MSGTTNATKLGGPHAGQFGFRSLRALRLVTVQIQGHGDAFTTPTTDFVRTHKLHYKIDCHEDLPGGPYYASTQQQQHEYGEWTEAEHDAMEARSFPTVEECMRHADLLLADVASRPYLREPAKYSVLGSNAETYLDKTRE